jgi:hypothetical protein
MENGSWSLVSTLGRAACVHGFGDTITCFSSSAGGLAEVDGARADLVLCDE